ncbi:Repeat domain-containing protein [Algoriphagus locisalis]|uniref:Repeat domain-containing protein n=1 Tax=Algoriphagus locisalis TaxID=305507 RepID=A0A1I7A070_9BACT|nr:VCBS repeat-containing protein [Algoriphagus locisalis]SFT68287.1 Repeat domain-containing protein [Algoriphagus locisalis]
MRRLSVVFLIGLGVVFSCQEKKEETLFQLMDNEQIGINFENTLTSTDSLNILEYLYFYNGGGVAAGDINNDGLVDLYFAGNQVSNRLYLNKGNFQFEDITKYAGVSGNGGWSTGVTMADVNGDGLLDIYVSQIGNYKGLIGRNRLYINQGNNQFKDQADEYGVDFVGFSTQAVFLDYDRDGDLDLYLLNHSVKSPEVFAQAKQRTIPHELGDKLFNNLISEGQIGFEDVTEASGIYSSILGFGLGVGVADFNDDGWPDIYVSNDFTENDYLYLNQQDGTFKESLENLISSTSRYSMGNDLADLNGDGLPEIFTTDMLPIDPSIWMKSVGEDKQEVYQIKKKFGYSDQYVRNHLQLNQGKEGFSEIALFSGVFASDWSWSPLIFDMDNDGLPDIHITNGIEKRPNDLDFIQYSQQAASTSSMTEIRRKQIEMLPTVKLPNLSYRNQGGLRFKDESKTWGLDQPSYSNGSAYADLDNDGDLDLIINNLNQPPFIYQNHSEKSGNSFVRVNLAAKGKNTLGLGAKVGVYFDGRSIFQQYSGSRGFMSGTSSTLVFGLGKAQAIDSIAVDWPTGEREIFQLDYINQTYILTQGKGKPNLSQRGAKQQVDSFPQIPWEHQEKNTLDETKREYLTPKSFAIMGPALAVGDVNNDGLEDIYVGGAQDQAGSLFIQLPSGEFIKKENSIFDQLAKAEDVVAEFADFDGDGNLDLYVGSAGNEYKSGALFNFDRIFYGNGQGDFQFNPMALPKIGENTSTIAIYDVDADGDLDIFVGSSVVSGDYGASPKSVLLINVGRGIFQDKTKEWFGSDADLGMINSAVWADLNASGKSELLLTGDWQGIRTFEIINSQSLREKKVNGLEFSAGWIQSLAVADVNVDGRLDILTGNLGLNTKLKASVEKPLWLYHGDFDENGQADPLIFHYMGDRLVPFASRDDLIKQIPGIKRKHSSYQDYSELKGPIDLFPEEVLSKSSKHAAYEFRSGAYLQQTDGSFKFDPFPDQAQLSPIFSVSWSQSNKSVLLGGNFTGFRVDLGINTAASFTSWQWATNGWKEATFQNNIPQKSEIRIIKKIKIGEHYYGLAASNSGPIYWIALD